MLLLLIMKVKAAVMQKIIVFIFGLKVEMVDLLILVSLIYVEIISRLFQEIIPKVN